MLRDESGKPGKDLKDAKQIMVLDVFGHQVPVYHLALTFSWGFFDLQTKQVYLHPTVPGGPLAELEAILHEVLHSIEIIGLVKEERLAERQVNTLALGLANVLERNPQLVQYILERVKGTLDGEGTGEPSSPKR